jgi:hypothetical protein
MSAIPEDSRGVDLELRACACVSLLIAGGGRVNIDSISEPFTSDAVRSVEPVGVGGGFGLGIVEVTMLVDAFAASVVVDSWWCPT